MRPVRTRGAGRRQALVGAPAIAAIALLWSASGCGVLAETTWRMSDRHMQNTVKEGEPVDLVQNTSEHRVVADASGVGVVCEGLTIGMERRWSVTKTYREYGPSKGMLSAALTAEAVYGLGLGAALAQGCKEGKYSCQNLVWMIPVVLDLAVTFYRYKTRRRPKLIHKRYHGVGLGAQDEPRARTPVTCPEGIRIVAAGSRGATTGLYLQPERDGRLSESELTRLRRYLEIYPQHRVYAVGPWSTQEATACEYTEAQGLARPLCRPTSSTPVR